MLKVNVQSLIYPFSGQITDIRKNQLIPTSKFKHNLLHQPVFITKTKQKSTKDDTTHTKSTLKVSPLWSNAFFDWNAALRNPWTILPSSTGSGSLSIPTQKKDSSENVILTNANFINERLPSYIKLIFDGIDLKSEGYVNQFGFWSLLYLDFSLNCLVPSSYYKQMLNLKTKENVIFLDTYNEVKYAMNYLSKFNKILYTNGSGRKFVKLPSFGTLGFTFDKVRVIKNIGNDLQYWTLWPLNNEFIQYDINRPNHANILRNLNQFTNELVSIHYYPTFFYEHYLYFESVSQLILHQIYNVVRTYRAQLKLQDNLGTNRLERRGYYLTVYSPFYELFMSEVKQEFGDIYLYLQLFGSLPFDSGSIESIPTSYQEFDSYYQSRFGHLLDFGKVNFDALEAKYSRSNLKPFQLFFTYSQMFDLMQTISPNLNLKPNVELITFDEIGEGNNVDEYDVNNTSVCRLVDYPLGEPMPINTLEVFPPNLFEVAENIRMSFESKFLSPYAMYSLPLISGGHDVLIQTDNARLANFRRNTAQRKIFKSLQKQVLNAKSIFHKYVEPNLIKNNIGAADFLFWTTYSVNTSPKFSVNAQGVLDVPPIAVSSDKLEFTTPNSSSFKLLSLLFQYLHEKAFNQLLQPISIVFLGAKNEPVADMIYRLTHGKWSVQRYGNDAEWPGKKANLLSINLKNVYDIVVSDMDQSIGATVASISANSLKQLRVCLEAFSKRLIFKLQYCLFHTLSSITALLREYGVEIAHTGQFISYGIIRSAWSKVGSLEIFLIIDKVRTEEKIPTDDELRKVVNTLGLSDPNQMFFTYMGTPRKFGLNDLNCKIFNVDVAAVEFPSVLSTFQNLSQCVNYGSSSYSDSNSHLTIFGTTNIQRIGLFMRNKQLYKVVSLTGGDHKPEGIFNPQRDYVIPGVRDVLVLSDAQRMVGWKILKALHQDKGTLDITLTAYDIGCRDYECAYMTVMDENTILKYVGYDRATILDVKRGITVVKEEVTHDRFVELCSKGHVFAYNSYFMGFNTRDELEKELTFVADQLVIKGFLFLSFYSMHDELRPVLKNHGFVDITKEDIAANKFTFGRYHAVATVSVDFVEEWKRKMIAKYDVYQIFLSANEVSFSCMMHGYSTNLDSMYFAPVFNLVSPCFLIHKK
ncbi:P-S4 protein [Mal de Rio Cuarto virus]|uniref:p-S4 protein n=1 Tax=Mal de Rio Cuarto virus TaxID=185954 RepID=Q8BE69_9REOV|nr:P-S4 protein [Mal de Rio Cuarto virus]AAN07093.1 P-S4 protein [Mal de Rio Cuarto virus]